MASREEIAFDISRHGRPFIIHSSFATGAVILGFFLLPLALLWQQTIGGKTLIPADVLFSSQPWHSAAAQFGVPYPQNHLLADLVLENYAWKQYLLKSLAQRELPLWNPYTFAGEPFLANGQHSALYPFSLIFYLLPVWQAYGWFSVSQLWLAGIWMYVLARVLNLHFIPAVIASVTYQLSAFFILSIVFPMVIAAAAWLPFILAMGELLIRQHPAIGGRPARAPWAIFGSLGLGMAMLAGHVEMIYPYTLFVLGMFAVWRLWASKRQCSDVSKLLQSCAWLTAMIGLGLALGAIQFLPMLEVGLHNFREDSVSLHEVVSWSYPWRRVIAFFVPNFFGNESHHAYLDVFSWQTLPAKVYEDGQYIWWGIKNSVEGAAYVGILPLVLAAYGILSAGAREMSKAPNLKSFVSGQRIRDWLRHPYIPFFLTLAMFSLALVFPTGLYAVIYHLPGLGQLHTPFRWVFPYTLSIAILAGFGADFLGQKVIDRTYARVRACSKVLCCSGLAVILAVLMSRLVFPTQTLRLADAAVTRLAKANTAFINGRMFYSYILPWILIFGMLLIASGIAVRFLSNAPGVLRSYHRIPQLLAVGVIVLDLFIYGYGFNPAVDPALLDYRPPVINFLNQDTELWRFTTYDPQGGITMNMNSGWWNELSDVRGYDSMFPNQYLRFMNTIEMQGLFAQNRIGPIRQASSLDSPLLDLLNVKYVLTKDQIPNPNFRLVYDREVRVYQNEAVMPRAFSIPRSCTIYAQDDLAAMAKYDPRHYVILTGSPLPSLEPASCILNSAVVTVYKANEVWIDVQTNASSWLILADSYFPGWIAYARPLGARRDLEKELKILRADGNFRAVQIEPGAWTVRFSYRPLLFSVGIIVTLTATGALMLIAGLYLWTSLGGRSRTR